MGFVYKRHSAFNFCIDIITPVIPLLQHLPNHLVLLHISLLTLFPRTMSSTNPNHPPGPYAPGKHIIPPPRPVSPATADYRLNHLMLRIKDPDKSLKFYCDCLGLHVVFIFNAGPWTIYYLGPRDVGTSTTSISRSLLYHSFIVLGLCTKLV